MNKTTKMVLVLMIALCFVLGSVTGTVYLVKGDMPKLGDVFLGDLNPDNPEYEQNNDNDGCSHPSSELIDETIVPASCLNEGVHEQKFSVTSARLHSL